MSSGFVPPGATEEPQSSSDKWARAKQQVEASRKAKPPEEGKQEGGKSLFDHLQANKAAKQEAFEEASKLRNQFRPLDDSEIEFLESIQQKERAQEAAVQKETSEQLQAFRKERATVETATRDTVTGNNRGGEADATVVAESWTTTKKRRRENIIQRLEGSKARKTSTDEVTEAEQDDLKLSKAVRPINKSDVKFGPTDTLSPSSEPSSKVTANAAPSTSMLGLDAYDSEDDD